jgi:hypothetical protein
MTFGQWFVFVLIVLLAIFATVVIYGRMLELPPPNETGGQTFIMEEIEPAGPATYINETGVGS